MLSVCFFNNKGGVGKTTLVCNVASYIATSTQLRVLLVDADPQCNATQLIVPDRDIERVYSREAKTKPRYSTLSDVLKPISAGEPQISSIVSPYPRSRNRFGVDLIAGHPHVSLLEDKLSQAWLNFVGGDLGGARVTNWNAALTSAKADDYDLIFFDVGPSLGALNRSVLVGVNCFLTPMGCDIFSLMGVQNIAEWLTEWLASYDENVSKCKRKWPIDRYSIQSDSSNIARFIGYTVQQYITKSKGGERRATKSFEQILARIPSTIDTTLKQFARDGIKSSALQLSDVPHMFSLVPMAQQAHTPIHRLESRDGLVGVQYAQRDEYAAFIERLSKRVLQNLALKVT